MYVWTRVSEGVGNSAWSRRVGSNGEIVMEKLFFLKCRTVGKCERAGRWRGIKRRNIWLSRLAAAWKCMTYQARLHCQRKTLQTRRVLSSESHSSALLINSLWELNYIRSNLHRHTLEPAGGRTRYCSWCSWCWWCWDVHEDDGQMTNETLSFCDVMTHGSWFNIIHLMDRKHILGLVLVPTVVPFWICWCDGNHEGLKKLSFWFPVMWLNIGQLLVGGWVLRWGDRPLVSTFTSGGESQWRATEHSGAWNRSAGTSVPPSISSWFISFSHHIVHVSLQRPDVFQDQL